MNSLTAGNRREVLLVMDRRVPEARSVLRPSMTRAAVAGRRSTPASRPSGSITKSEVEWSTPDFELSAGAPTARANRATESRLPVSPTMAASKWVR